MESFTFTAAANTAERKQKLPAVVLEVLKRSRQVALNAEEGVRLR